MAGEIGKSPQSANSQTANAVTVEPVLGSNFPAKGKIQGNLSNLARASIFSAQSASGFNGLQQNSLLKRTENYFRRTGKIVTRTGKVIAG
jgi:hypothetical protein